MQYQVFVQPHPDRQFVASILGMPQVSVVGNTEAEAIARVKAAWESQLATGKIVTIEVAEVSIGNSVSFPTQNDVAGLFADDPTFEDWMEKLTAIRQAANQTDDLA